MKRPIPAIREYMTPAPHTIGPTATLADAHALMRTHGIRHLPVVDEGALVGLVSVHDLHLMETLPDVDPGEVPVEDAMTDTPYVVAPGEPLDQVALAMAENKYGSAIVIEDEVIVGVFTAVDGLRALHALLVQTG